MRIHYLFIIGLFVIFPNFISAQEKQELKGERSFIDEQFIYDFENEKEPYKVLHAEPLHIDLIPDPGARKGEHEWYVGFGPILELALT